MHSRGETNFLLQQLDVQKPDLLWIRLGTGNKVDRRGAANLVELANKYLNEGKKLVLEADVHCGA
jgi:hypothetical protein